MQLSTFLDPRDVVADLSVATKPQLLAELASRAAAALGRPAEPIRRALAERELLGSTGLGDGIALPHARLDDITRPFGLLARLRSPVDFAAIDGRAVDLVALLLFPKPPAAEHLAMMAAAARLLRDPERAARLRAAPDAAALAAVLAGSA